MLQGKTHLRVGLASGVASAYVMGYESEFVALSLSVVIAGFASLLPDIDEDGSYVNKLLFSYLHRKYRSFALAALGAVIIACFLLFEWPQWTVLLGVYAVGVAYIPHRSLTHSIIGMVYVNWVFHLALPEYYLAFFIGYLSHLVTDALTVAGIPLFWPYKKRYGLKSIGLKVRTGKLTDIYLGRVTLILFCVSYILLLGSINWS